MQLLPYAVLLQCLFWLCFWHIKSWNYQGKYKVWQICDNGVVDGIFVSNFAQDGAFAGLNLIYPVIMIVGGVGFMIGTGGSALVSKLLGEQEKERANQVFSMMVIFTAIFGAIISIIGSLLIKPIALALASVGEGNTENMIKYAIIYGRILMLGQVTFMLQNLFQSFFVVAEKPQLGFIYTVSAGVTNIILDALFSISWISIFSPLSV